MTVGYLRIISQCVIFSSVISLLIDKPDVTSSGPGSFSVKENETATLKCTLNDANPSTNIKWRWFDIDFPNSTLDSRGPTYVINYIKRSMSGSYGCTARNSVGESKEATINVSVQCKLIGNCILDHLRLSDLGSLAMLILVLL